MPIKVNLAKLVAESNGQFIPIKANLVSFLLHTFFSHKTPDAWNYEAWFRTIYFNFCLIVP